MILPTGSTFYPTNTQGVFPHVSANAQQQQRTNSNNMQAKQGGQNDSQFLVNLDRILNREDFRTTVMIRHIPNKYT